MADWRAVVSYALSDELDVKALERALKRTLDSGQTAAADRRFYDTFDGRLYDEELALAYERGRLVVLDTAGQELASAPAKAAPRRLFDADLPEGPIRDRLAPVIEMRVLLPVGRAKVRRRTLAVLDDLQKTVVRLHVEAPDRLHVAGVRGYEKEHDRVIAVLDDLGLERTSGIVGPVPGVSSKPNVKLKPEQTGAKAAAKLCLRLVEVIRATLPGTLADTDSEFLHDLRVAVRRTRSLQRELKAVFDPDTLPGFRDDFKWLQQVTGPVRDLDVYLLDFDAFRAALAETREDDIEPLRDLLIQRRRSERRKLVRALKSARTEDILTRWTAELQTMKGGPAVTEVAGERITKVYARMVKDGSKIDDDTPAEALHDLRKKGKELRYLLEFFGGLYPEDVAKPMVKSLKALQDTLGRHQDREVQAELITQLGEDISDTKALMAMGQLVERLEAGMQEARAEFAERFAAFASKDQRKLVKETFV